MLNTGAVLLVPTHTLPRQLRGLFQNQNKKVQSNVHGSNGGSNPAKYGHGELNIRRLYTPYILR